MGEETGRPTPPPPEAVTHVVGTAGHVDHGKSTLVRALTGTDPDRWAEEQARGLTIDLGFAAGVLPSGRALSFVDVPGHVAYLGNMLAGVGAVDACLFVVDAHEGWRAQSEEHLRILELLGISGGVVALTKAGDLDEDAVALARTEVAERLEGSPLADAEDVAVDAPAALGVDDLRAALDRLLNATPPAADRGRPRLWIDRSFPIAGAGTVVTGTLTGGVLAVGDRLAVQPAGTEARIRALQSHGHDVTAIAPGHRVAVNLVGVAHDDVGRGDALVVPGRWQLTDVVDAEVRVLPTAGAPLARRGAHHLHLGTADAAVRVRVLGPERLAPGEAGLVRLHLPAPLAVQPGDRFVLRDVGRGETVAGGTVLDVDPRSRAADPRPVGTPAGVVAARGWVDVDELERLTGARSEPTVGRWVVDPAALAATVADLGDRILAAGPAGVDVAGLDERARAVLDRVADVVVADGRARAATTVDPLDGHPWLAALDASPFAPPPPPEDLDPRDVRTLAQRGHVAGSGQIWFSAAALDAAGAAVAELLRTHPEGVTVAQVRDALGTTRKYVVPLLEALDATGRTRRRGDLRIAGPRLESP